MERRLIGLAAAFAALTALSSAVFAQSAAESLQNGRRDRWILVSERGEQAPAFRTLYSDSVFGAEMGMLRSSDFRPSLGLQLDLAQSWVLCADWDRYRPKMLQARDNVDTFLLGLQYRFH
jgi:hypothetical protein